MKLNSTAKYYLWVVSFLAIAFITGCATYSPIDWQSRVGHYTYAEAVQEFGPPNRQIQLSNGTTEFRWIARKTPVNPGFHAGGMDANTGFENSPNTTLGVNDHYLQLTFDAKGVLINWSRNY